HRYRLRPYRHESAAMVGRYRGRHVYPAFSGPLATAILRQATPFYLATRILGRLFCFLRLRRLDGADVEEVADPCFVVAEIGFQNIIRILPKARAGAVVTPADIGRRHAHPHRMLLHRPGADLALR